MPDGRTAVVSCTVTEVALPLVTFEGSTAIGKEIMRSTSTLRFRERNELERDLSRHGFHVLEVREVPDRPGKEMVFEPLSCAIGWARLARSDVDQLFCMGLACRRASVYVRCVLAVVRRPLRCLMNQRNGRSAGRVAVSREPETFRAGFLRLVAGLGA
jgi:hypothetical protein